MSHLYDYIDAGFRVFGIHGVQDGICGCGDENCKALYKHPVISSWQNVPHWSEEQIDTFHQIGHFDTGFGVLCSGWLILDIDARNGGVESFTRLVADIPEAGQAAFVVNTGSGQGSQHHYFRLVPPMAMMQSHPSYPGIDFKTSGYVIGADSLHVSGAYYEVARGLPQDITDAPAALLDLLSRPEYYRASTDSGDIDVDVDHLRELLSYVSPDLHYESWIKIGMAIHHTMRGDGFELWDDWSSSGSSYPGAEPLGRHWHSFGKAPNPAGYGTLLHYAREGGYCEPVTFVYEPTDEVDYIDTTAVDLKRPPGFVGELTEWINDQCLYPRETLAVAAALCAVSSLAGMRHVDALDDMSANIIAFCVAGSGSGKEALQQAYLAILRAAGVQGAVHGGFKSEQELMRNLIRHQAAFYVVDELGLVLRKLENASKRGGASYLEGIIGLIMSVYSKANGYLPITGDLKEEIRDKLRSELARNEKRKDDLPGDSSADAQRGRLQRASDRILEALRSIDDGLDSPYLTILGFTTPVTFNELMGFEQATNGLMARAMIFNELETNPKRKQGFRKRTMLPSMESAIRNLYAPGRYDPEEDRVEHTGDKVEVPTTQEARQVLEQVYEYFHAEADKQKGNTGLEAIPRRGYELTSKVSLILALPGGVRTAEHVQWAFALAKRDVDQKIQLAYSTDREDSSGLAARVLAMVTPDHGETLGTIANRLRSEPRKSVEALLEQMLDRGMLRVSESNHPVNGTLIRRFFGVE